MKQMNIISISGGKDSTATALLAIERKTENLKFVFADTGHEHSATYEFIDYLDGEFTRLAGVGIDRVSADFSDQIKTKRLNIIQHFIELDDCGKGNRRLKQYTASIMNRMIDLLANPTGVPFLDLCILKGRFPGTRTRFCSEHLKHYPLNNYQERFMASSTAVVSWQGVRRDESISRASLLEKDVEFGSWQPEPFGLLIYRPILDWKAEDCFAQHTKFNLMWNPLYEKGMGRVGCMPCIHATKAEIREISRRFPEEFERVAEWESLVSQASKRGISTLMDARTTAKFLSTGNTADDMKIETHGINGYVDWAMTARGGRQFDLINTLDATEVPTCSSVYGLCE